MSAHDPTLRVLVVDDDPGVRFTLRATFEDAGALVDEANDGADGLAKAFAAADAAAYDVIVSDLRMPKVDGLELLRRAREKLPKVRVILVTAHGSERHAVEAMKRGAFDYFAKPFDPAALVAAAERAVESVRLARDNERLAGELNLSRSLLFASPSMSRLAVLVGRVAPRDVTVLITGESGTGKERVAEAVVRASARANKPFVRFNCASIGPELAEAELFGHTKGAFTGASTARLGLFRQADGGTLLLDEVGELDLQTQAKLLRVMQDGDVRPLGEDRSFKVNVRVVACTHRDLPAMVAARTFREDLHYRLRVVHLHVPPLRERPEDIPVLVRHFFDRAAERFATGPIRVTDAITARLVAHDWPGNVRELENTVESLVALSHEGEIDEAMLPSAKPARTSDPDGEALDGSGTLKQQLDAYERGLVVRALRLADDNRSEAARRLGISRATLHEKLAKHGLK